MTALLGFSLQADAAELFKGADRSDHVSGVGHIELLNAYHQPLPRAHINGKTWVLGTRGQQYKIRVSNHAVARAEAVVAVDGRDAVSGKPATKNERGYILSSYGETIIDGFRLDLNNVATFRFAEGEEAYATQMGDDLRLGIIGAAIFPEKPRIQRPVYRDGSPSFRNPATFGAESLGMSKGGVTRGGATRGGATRGGATRGSMGTEFGEHRQSQVSETSFDRANPIAPFAVLELRYTDVDGLIDLGLSEEELAYIRAIDQPSSDVGPFTDDTGRFSQPPPGW